MSLSILKPGLLSTVQDLGRIGARRHGVNTNGPMDSAAVRAINAALGNDENAAVIEMHFPAPAVKFDRDIYFGVAGADFGAELNGKPVDNWTTINAKKTNVLKFRQKVSGNRAYLAVKGGIEVKPWLGSASTNLFAGAGGHNGRALISGDLLQCERSNGDNPIAIGRSLIPRYSRFPTLRVIPGGEFDLLTAVSERLFQSTMFTLTAESNRMGFRVKGEPLHLLYQKEMVTAAASYGTIQLLPGGQMIVLMADHQTAGGYPRIANIISVDLPIAGQLGPGDQVMFKIVTVEESELLSTHYERDMRFFRMGCQFQSGLLS